MSTPPRQTTADFDPEVMRLFDQYVHGQLDRRGFLDRAARVAGSAVGASALLAALSPNFALAQKVPPNDARLKTETVEFPSPAGYGRAKAYVVRPAQPSGPLPVVLVVHENRGWTRTSKTSRAGWRWTTSSPWRPTPCSRWAATRAPKTRRANCSASWTRPR